MEEQITIESLEKRFADCLPKLDIENKKKKISELEGRVSAPDFWSDPQHAASIMEEIEGYRQDIGNVDVLKKTIDDLRAMKDLGMETEYAEEILKVERLVGKFEVQTFLSGEYDRSNAILTIRAGQGGTEAMDWAEMLLRMYLRYAEKMGWKTDTVDQTDGDEAGIKTVTIQILGRYAFGYLKGEDGVHRLVRQSPFNADKLRQTSFSEVEVIPQIEEASETDISDDDLTWEFFRASSHGGQNVQKVSTAVRLTHKPTGIIVNAQSERFQEQNRKIALGILQSKLWERNVKAKEVEKKELQGEHKIAGWGNQIRSYVLHPYKMVKDLRTEVESSDPDGVLNGELDKFIDAELRILG